MTVILILINLFIQMTRIPIEIFKDSSGFFDDTYAPMLESGINLVLSIILVQKLGLNGVIIGTVASNLVVILFLKPILTFRRCFDRTAMDYLRDFSKNLALTGVASIICGGIFTKLSRFMRFDSWMNLLISVACVGVLVSIVSFTTFLMNRDFREMVKDVVKK